MPKDRSKFERSAFFGHLAHNSDEDIATGYFKKKDRTNYAKPKKNVYKLLYEKFQEE